MSLIIRQCELKDAAAVARLNLEEMGYDYPVNRTERKLQKLLADPSHLVLVAENEGKVVGYVHAEEYELLYFDAMVNIMGIAVSSNCRRMGAGRALMKAVENWAREIGADGVRLVSGAQRVGAHRFYESCGFTGGKMQVNFKKSL